MELKKVRKFLEKLGFEIIQGEGGHVRFKQADGRRTVVPVHAKEDLGKGLLN
jgi:predicted RNA binding protein YcfA (HicA-like mRNA interferase family)